MTIEEKKKYAFNQFLQLGNRALRDRASRDVNGFNEAIQQVIDFDSGMLLNKRELISFIHEEDYAYGDDPFWKGKEYPAWEKQLIRYDLKVAGDFISYLQACEDYFHFSSTMEEDMSLRAKIIRLLDEHLFDPGFYQILEMLHKFPDEFIPTFIKGKNKDGFEFDFASSAPFYQFNPQGELDLSTALLQEYENQKVVDEILTESNGFWEEWLKGEENWCWGYENENRLFLSCFQDDEPQLGLLEQAKNKSVKALYLWLKLKGVEGEGWFQSFNC